MTRIAAVQMVSGTDVDANLTAAAALIHRAAADGARLVALPENFGLMPGRDADRLAAAEDDGRGAMQDFLSTEARRHGIWLVGGTIPIRTGGERVRAACCVVNDRGERVARYDKIHLFDASLSGGDQKGGRASEDYRESATIEPGSKTVSVETPWGRLGLSVCYDLRFPELYRELSAQGCTLLVAPSAFTATTGRAHWEVLIRARAVENLAWLLAPNQGGRHSNGRETFGHTAIVNPWGQIVATATQGEAVVLADFDEHLAARVRAQLPALQHRRLTV
ncbi:MAG: carbon-nitrogen hydrolase family protein [Pseudomonadota bacterium]